jgi:tellurite resistance protein
MSTIDRPTTSASDHNGTHANTTHSGAPSAAPAPGQTLRMRVPPNTFGASFGLAGLAESWSIVGDEGRVSTVVADVLMLVAAAIWALSVLGYLISGVRHPRSIRHDLTDPTAAPFVPLALIVPMLLIGLGLADHAPDLSAVLIDVLIGLTVVHGAWFTGQLFYGDYPFEKLHPGYFLPTIAGGLIAAAAAASVNQDRLGYVMLGYGLICWAILGSLIFARIVSGPSLPDALLPTMAIEVAPAAVATLAYFALNGYEIDTFVAILAGYGVLMALAQIRLVPRFFQLKFSLGFWAFTFAWAAVANATLYWIDITHPGGQGLLSWIVLIAISVLIGAITLRSLSELVQGRYFPRQ